MTSRYLYLGNRRIYILIIEELKLPAMVIRIAWNYLYFEYEVKVNRLIKKYKVMIDESFRLNKKQFTLAYEKQFL